VGGRDLVGDGESEAPVLVDLVGRRLAPQQRHRGTYVLESGVPEFFDRAVPGVFHLGLGCDDLIEQLALAVQGARFDVGL
jgi:hypothetical protein